MSAVSLVSGLYSSDTATFYTAHYTASDHDDLGRGSLWGSALHILGMWSGLTGQDSGFERPQCH